MHSSSPEGEIEVASNTVDNLAPVPTPTRVVAIPQSPASEQLTSLIKPRTTASSSKPVHQSPALRSGPTLQGEAPLLGAPAIIPEGSALPEISFHFYMIRRMEQSLSLYQLV